MTKEEAKLKLRKSGYNVIDDNSVVTVVIAPEVSMKNAVKDVKDKLTAWGYSASFGIKQHKGAGEFAASEEESLQDADMLEDTEDVAEVADDIEDSAEETVQSEKEADSVKKPETKAKKTEADNVIEDNRSDSSDGEDDEEYYDEEDSDMLLTEESIQFSLEDFGLDF